MNIATSLLKLCNSRFTRYSLLTAFISLLACGALLINSDASPQEDKFTIAEATTTDSSGKQIRAKSGFELVMKDKTTAVARKTSKNTMSVDKVMCTCSPAPPGGSVCGSYSEGDGTRVCGSEGSSSCCKWIPVK